MRRLLPWVLLAIVLLPALALWYVWRANPHSNALRAREMATRALAEALVKAQAGSRAVVLSNPFSREKTAPREIVATEAAGVRGLRRGFSTNIVLEAVAFPELKSEAQKDPRSVFIDAETTTPLSYLVAEDAFDQVARQYPECDLLVSLVGLPEDLDRVQCWQTNGPPQFGLLLPDLRIIGDRSAVVNAVKRGKLAAFVLPKPGAPDSDEMVGRDFAAEFDRRFVLVTSNNIEQVTQTYTNLF